MIEYITDFTYAQEEARRLTKVLGRDIEVKAVNCDCDYSKLCYMCGGEGLWYQMRYGFCDHVCVDNERDGDCFDSDCAERERLQKIMQETDHLADPFEGIERPLLSIPESYSEEKELEVTR